MKQSIGLFLLFLGLSQGDALAKANYSVLAEPQETVTNVATVTPERVLKRKVAISRFSNETQYAKGIFYDKENDPMSKQALDILSTRLSASEKFLLLEREDLTHVLAEAEKAEGLSNTLGADYIIVGSITQFGRKNVGESRVFSSKKSQIVEAAVSIRLIDVSTGLIIYSDEARGEAVMTTKNVMGFGGKADYDATLSDKAIAGAIGQLVNNIIAKCTDNPWKSFIIANDESGMIMAGGKSQGIVEGDEFYVLTKGRQVKNPQTGMMITLPGKEVGKVKIVMTGGDTPDSEFSILDLVSGEVNTEKLDNYIIQESL